MKRKKRVRERREKRIRQKRKKKNDCQNEADGYGERERCEEIGCQGPARRGHL